MKVSYLLTVVFVFVCLMSCMQEEIKTGSSPEGEEVEVTFDLITLKMEDIMPSGTTKPRSTDNVLDVTFEHDKTITRAARSLTPTEEAAIKTISYFEFTGTAATSTCVKKGTATMNTVNNKVSLVLTTSTAVRTVYIIANLGNITGSVANNITLANFKNLTYTLANDANVANTGLPMAGFANTTTGHNGGTIVLQRLVAKVRVVCSANVPANESFSFTSMRLVNVPKIGAYSPKANFPPNNLPANFGDYPTATSTDQVWYIPENRRGTVTNTDPKRKNGLAPAYSTYVEVIGVYTKSNVKNETIYRVYLGGNATNNYELLSNRNYQINIVIKSFNAADARIFVVEDFSLLATANCYVALKKNGWYKFNAKVMGNGKTIPAFTATFTISGTSYTQNAPQIAPKVLNPRNVILIWETGTTAGQVIQSETLSLGSDGYVRFQVANNDIEGNALIGVTDNNNNILWSWHIWKTTYNPNTSKDAYTNKQGRRFNMMKYNLGAMATGSNWNANTSYAGNLGLLYQWGRKDPFLGAQGWANSSPRMSSVTHPDHAWADGNSASIPNTGPSGSPIANAAASVAYAIAHPTHFLTGNTGTNDWLNAATYANQFDNLWGNPNRGGLPNLETGSKSIYDPCPPGWRTPRSDCWTGFTESGGNITDSSMNKFNITSEGFNRGFTFYINASPWRTGNTSYYPSAGYRGRNNGGFGYVGMEGNPFSSSAAGTVNPRNGTYLFYRIPDYAVRPSTAVTRGHAMIVRCEEE